MNEHFQSRQRQAGRGVDDTGSGMVPAAAGPPRTLTIEGGMWGPAEAPDPDQL